MNEPAAFAALESRLRKLERQNRLLLACLMAGIVVAACTSATLSAPTEMRSQRFVLVDSGGKEVGWWEADPAGFPRFSQGTNRNLPAIQMAQLKEGPHVALHANNSNSHWIIEKGEVKLLLNGEINSQGHSSVSLRAGKASGIAIASPAQGRLDVEPQRLSFRKPKASLPWVGLNGDNNSLELNGVKLKLNDPAGKPIQELP
jgi:hypothetical protein